MTRSLISGRRSATVAFATTAFKRLLLASALKERRGAAFAVPSPCFRTHPFLAFGSKRSFRDTASASSGEKLRIRGQRARTFAGQMGSDDDGETSGADFDLAQDPSELFDVYPPPPSPSHRNAIVTPEWGASYFPSPGPTGRTKERGRVHADGDWHRSVQAWIVQADAEGGGRVRVLLQRRSPYKDTHPNQLDVSCAGHVDAGENTLDTVVRELEEELGGNGAMRERFTKDDIERARAFTVASSICGGGDREIWTVHLSRVPRRVRSLVEGLSADG
ncbi:hypothetical protein ACHAWF_002539 [Thalassiosira exigua]